MNFEQYTKEAKKTITFDSNEKLLFCCTTGLMGEFSEYIEHNNNNSKSELIVKEIGDVCWYIAILSDHLGLNVESDTTHLIPTTSTTGFILIGHIQEILKKSVRDNNWELSPNKKEELEVLFQGLMFLLYGECAKHNTDISEVLEANIEKLSSRQKRGKLQGSGDER